VCFFCSVLPKVYTHTFIILLTSDLKVLNLKVVGFKKHKRMVYQNLARIQVEKVCCCKKKKSQKSSVSKVTECERRTFRVDIVRVKIVP
jgi:hypothetical protein